MILIIFNANNIKIFISLCVLVSNNFEKNEIKGQTNFKIQKLKPIDKQHCVYVTFKEKI